MSLDDITQRRLDRALDMLVDECLHTLLRMRTKGLTEAERTRFERFVDITRIYPEVTRENVHALVTAIEKETAA